MMIRCHEKVYANIVKLQSDQREYGQRLSNQLDADRICKRSEEKLTAALNYIQSKKKEPEKSQKFRRAQVDYNQVGFNPLHLSQSYLSCDRRFPLVWFPFLSFTETPSL